MIGAAETAQTLDASSIRPGTNKALLFHHRTSITIQASSLVYSGPIMVSSKPLSNLTITFFIPQLPGTLTEHQLASAPSFQVMGNQVGDAGLEAPIRFTNWEYLNGIDVLTSRKNSAIVTLGDSITDGAYSKIDGNVR